MHLGSWVATVSANVNLAPASPSVGRTPTPGAGDVWLAGLVLLLLGSAIVLLVLRRRRGYRGIRTFTAGVAVGNAFMDLNSVYQPHHADAAIICKLEEEELRDDAAEGPTPWTAEPNTEPNKTPYRGDESPRSK